jgi:hypothetical protein
MVLPASASKFAVEQFELQLAAARKAAALEVTVPQASAWRGPSHVYDADWFVMAPAELTPTPEPARVRRPRRRRLLAFVVLMLVAAGSAAGYFYATGNLSYPAG